MKPKFLLITTLALLAALLLSGAVFAEGEVPDAHPADVPQPSAAEEPLAPPEVQPVDVVVEAPPDLVEVAPVEPAVEVPAVSETPVEAAIPLGTVEEPAAVEAAIPVAEPQVVLADPAGEPMDMASQKSADLITSGDPYWFVGAQKYATVRTTGTCPLGTTETVTCWVNVGSPITEALTRIETGLLPTDRKLYILLDTYSENISIDAANSLDAIKGQLNGFIGNPDGAGIPTLNGSITLTNMTGGFTLSNFIINNGIKLDSTSGTVLLKDLKVHNPYGKGIEIGSVTSAHVGNVTIQNVNSNNNKQIGAEIYVQNGAVKIINSSFDFNDDGVSHSVAFNGTTYNVYGGLFLGVGNGAITLDGVSTSKNNGFGTFIFSFNKPLTIKNSQFNGNLQENGLRATGENNAPVTLDTVFANTNDQHGIYLQTGGTMTLNNVEASYSINVSGVRLDHSATTAAVKVSSSRFFENGLSGAGNGLDIESLGSVTLTSIASLGNNGHGIFVDNCLDTPVSGICTGSGTVTITSSAAGGALAANTFNGNTENGVYIQSKGKVTLQNFTANSNDHLGVEIFNEYGTGAIAIGKTLTGWVNTADDNGSTGIDLASVSTITLANTSACWNDQYGVITNKSNRSVAISAGQFDYNINTGLRINSSGNITLTDVGASNNDRNHTLSSENDGAMIDSGYGNGSVTVKSSKPTVWYEFDNNTGNGLRILSNGPMTVSNVNAIGNVSGIVLENTGTGLAKTVTLARSNADGNVNYGIYVTTAGNTTFDTVSASENGNMGAWVNGCLDDGSGGCLTTASFTLKGSGSYFDKNGSSGFYILTKGVISLTNISATGNGSDGVCLINRRSNTTAGVTIGSKGGFWNTISSNNTSLTLYNMGGLVINTYGAITLTRVDASRNNGIGAYLYNRGATSPKALTMTDCIFHSNEKNDGLLAQIFGPIIGKGLSASYNSRHNQWIESENTETLYDMLTSDTYEDFWWVKDTVGGVTFNISLDSADFDAVLEIFDDTGSRMYIRDLSSSGTESISYLTSSPTTFYIRVSGKGGIGDYELAVNDPSNADPSWSNFFGAYLDNSTSTSGVTITSSTLGISRFNENNWSGLNINSNGFVALSNLKADLNEYSGVMVETSKNVSVSNNHPTQISTFNDNEYRGLNITTTGGTITVNNRIIASGNGNVGISLSNGASSTSKTVTVSKVATNDNGSRGLEVFANGIVNLANLESKSNGSHGVSVDNTYGTVNNAVNVSGSSLLAINYESGLWVESHGAATVSGVVAEYNTYNGIRVNAASATLRSITSRYNEYTGAYVLTTGNVLFNNFKSFSNGFAGYMDGVNVQSIGSHVTFQSCVVMGNMGDGIEVNTGGFPSYVTLTNTYSTGNDTNNSGTYYNLNIY